MSARSLLLLSLLLIFKLICVSTEDDDGRSRRILFKFNYEGEQTICDYRHPHYGYVKIPVPHFMRTFTAERIAEELQLFLQEGQQWSQRMILEMLYYALTYGKDYKPLDFESTEFPCLQSKKSWLDASTDVCQWEGITCGNIHPSQTDRPRVELKLFGKQQGTYDWGPWEEFRWPSKNIITKIDLPEMKCKGTLPEDLSMLHELRRLNLRENAIHSTIPSTYGDLLKLEFLDLSHNQLTGVPWQLSKLSKTLEELWLGDNHLGGAVHFYLSKMTTLHALDISQNQISGTVPADVKDLKRLKALFMEKNKIIGKVPPQFGQISDLEYLHLNHNHLTGPIPHEIVFMVNLRHLHLDHNRINGTLPSQVTGMHSMVDLKLGSNRLSGKIPVGDDMGGEEGFRWSRMATLENLDLSKNRLTGTLPPPFVLGMAGTLTSLDLGFNSLTGTLPPELGRMKYISKLSAPFNKFEGTLPFELGRLLNLNQLNITSNKLVGTIPQGLCDEERGNYNVLLFGCSAILCPAGTFHPHGAADNLGACRTCPKSKTDDLFDPPFSTMLGRTACDEATFLIGDKNADGMQSPREILHFLYMQNGGVNWGNKFRDWLDNSIPDCELPGITCVGVDIAKIDLSDANLCADETGREADYADCHGIPAELRLLSNLEVIALPRRQFLRGTIPTELGMLPKLRFLDISGCPQMTGPIPSELGNLSNLKVLVLSHSQFSGSIPSQLFKLPQLEKLHLSANRLTGTIPRQVGEAKNLRELMLSRLMLSGTIPKAIGKLSSVENLELYGSNIRGRIPSEVGRCSSLKRLDAFNNKLTGTIPTTLAKIESLQIIHLKKNQLTGRLPEELGKLHFLTWIDVTSNIISGTIPSSYGSIRTLKDLRLGGNRIHGPIPTSLCNNVKINGGRSRSFGCDAILCPLGQYDATGFAFDLIDGCHQCQKGTTIYLGSTECVDLHVDDILSMLYDVMGGELWDQSEVFRWKSEINICHWNGIICEDDGTLVSLSFPLTQATDPLGDPPGSDHTLYYPE